MDEKQESEDQPLGQEDLEKTTGGGMPPEVDEKPHPGSGHSSKEWWQ
ncbi:MAG: hypothetical protein WCP28_14890 [Actinomycetes bacterium]